jgi:hypothetical protein
MPRSATFNATLRYVNYLLYRRKHIYYYYHYHYHHYYYFLMSPVVSQIRFGRYDKNKVPNACDKLRLRVKRSALRVNCVLNTPGNPLLHLYESYLVFRYMVRDCHRPWPQFRAEIVLPRRRSSGRPSFERQQEVSREIVLVAVCRRCATIRISLFYTWLAARCTPHGASWPPADRTIQTPNAPQ